jgi:hypothetical protein
MAVADVLEKMGEADRAKGAAIYMLLTRMWDARRNNITVTQTKPQEEQANKLIVTRKGVNNTALIEKTQAKAITEILANHQSASETVGVNGVDVTIQKNKDGRIRISASEGAVILDKGRITGSGNQAEIQKLMGGVIEALPSKLPAIEQNELHGINKILASEYSISLEVSVDEKIYTVGKYQSGQVYVEDAEKNRMAFNPAAGPLGIGGNEVVTKGNTEQILGDLPKVEAQLLEVMPLAQPKPQKEALEIDGEVYQTSKQGDAFRIEGESGSVTYREDGAIEQTGDSEKILEAVASLGEKPAEQQEEIESDELNDPIDYENSVDVDELAEEQYRRDIIAAEAKFESETAPPENEFELEPLIDPAAVKKAEEEVEEIEEIVEAVKTEPEEEFSEVKEETREVIYGEMDGLWADGLDRDTALALNGLMSGEIGALIAGVEGLEVKSGGEILFAANERGEITHNAFQTVNGLSGDRNKQQTLGITKLQASVNFHINGAPGIKVTRLSDKLAKVPKTAPAGSQTKPPKLNPDLGKLYREVLKPGFKSSNTMTFEGAKFTRSKNKVGGYAYQMELDGKKVGIASSTGADQIAPSRKYKADQSLQEKVAAVLGKVQEVTKQKEATKRSATVPRADIEQVTSKPEQNRDNSRGMAR